MSIRRSMRRSCLPQGIIINTKLKCPQLHKITLPPHFFLTDIDPLNDHRLTLTLSLFTTDDQPWYNALLKTLPCYKPPRRAPPLQCATHSNLALTLTRLTSRVEPFS